MYAHPNIIKSGLLFLLLFFSCYAYAQKTTRWVKQKAQTDIYRFELEVIKTADTDGRNFIPQTIRVISKKDNHVVQTIGVSEAFNGNVAKISTALDITDCNFDGYKDLMIFSHDGGAGPNYGYDFYLYNPIKKRFELDEVLSDLSQPFVDSKTKTIQSSWRGGAASHGGETYRFIKGKLTMIANWNDECSATYPICYSYTGKLVKGKWIQATNIFTYTDTNAVFIYSKPLNNIAPADSVKNGNTVTIIKEYPKWAWAEYYNDKRVLQHGWVKKEAFFNTEGDWIKQRQQTDHFNFELNNGLLKINKKGADTLHQLIIGVFGEEQTDSLLQLNDYNFDGQNDISIRTAIDKSATIPYQIFDEEKYKLFNDCYIYNTTEQVFEKDTLLSKLANITTDKKEKIITSKNWELTEKKEVEYRIEKYSFSKAGKWIPIEKAVINEQGSNYKLVTHRLLNDHWIAQSRIISTVELRAMFQ